MAFLAAGRRPRSFLALLAGACLVAALPAAFAPAFAATAPATPTREYQVKAVFILNFTRFIEWPPRAFARPDEPFVIGIVGEDPFHGYLDEVVRGETFQSHPLVVRHTRDPQDLARCQILFVARAEQERVASTLAGLRDRPILTVGEGEPFLRQGGAIGLISAGNKIRLHINLAATRTAGLVVSSKLLRAAETSAALAAQR